MMQEKGMNGICTITSKSKKSFISEKKFLFKVDTLEKVISK